MEWREIVSSSSQTGQMAGSYEHGNKPDVTHTVYILTFNVSTNKCIE